MWFVYLFYNLISFMCFLLFLLVRWCDNCVRNIIFWVCFWSLLLSTVLLLFWRSSQVDALWTFCRKRWKNKHKWHNECFHIWLL
jgi:hypothetical protein